MKVILQRVSSASVSVNGKIAGAVNQGILILLGVMKGDQQEDVDYLAQKIAAYRIFPDEHGRMNKSLLDIKGEALVVSQFTLAADGKKGRRPSFDNAAPPEEALLLYEKFIQKLRSLNIQTATGIFGAYMEVTLVNDGPVTFVMEHTSH